MSDLPGDPWTALLVGHQWPGSSALAILSAAAASRHSVGTSFHGYADALRSVSDTVLSDQQGDTADGIRASFRHGEGHARGIAERNTAKKTALDRAHRCASELRSALAEIADRGSGQIRSILDGKEPAAAKIAGIMAVAQTAQTDADARAALCIQDVYGSIQTVLDTSGHDRSARQFAHTHGVGSATLHSAPDPDVLHQRVQEMVERHSATDQPAAHILTDAMLGGRGAQPLTAAVDEPATPAPDPAAVQQVPVVQPVSAAPATAANSAPGRPRTAPVDRPLMPYGADRRPAATSGSATSGVAAPVSAPRTTAQTAGPTTAVAAALTRTAGPARAGVEWARPGTVDTRLRDLLHTLARQRPALRWAVGANASGTVAATDLASGWIPPHIDIPAGVGLLEPAVRTGRLTDWFGAGAVTVTHDPGGPLPPGGDPVAAHSRPAFNVEDFGGKLIHVTGRRDGLPRLAHTVAKAAIAELGLLPSEATLLLEHLAAAADRTLAGYPDSTDVIDVGNWQLLASIEALVDGDNSLARYHFAWFEALNP